MHRQLLTKQIFLVFLHLFLNLKTKSTVFFIISDTQIGQISSSGCTTFKKVE